MLKAFAALILIAVLDMQMAPKRTDAAGSEPLVGEKVSGGIIVPTEQLIRPAGKTVEFKGRPVDLAVAPDGKHVYLKDNSGIVVIEAESWQVKQELKLAEGASMHGIRLSHDGRRLYATGSGDSLFEAAVASDGKVKVSRQISFQKRLSKKGPATYPCGIALSPDDKTAYVCASMRNTLAIVDLSTEMRIVEVPVDVAPFDVVLSPDGKTAYVSNWGGRKPKQGERTAKSAGTDTLVDNRGIACSGTVGVIDLAARSQVAEIAVGLHPAGMALSRDGKTLLVANANSDTVSIIDTATRKVRETVLVRPDPSLPFGSASNALAFAPDEKTVYVANGGNNALAVVELGDDPSHGRPSRVAGFIPAGWYPGAVACAGEQIFVVNIKGIGSREKSLIKPGMGWSSHYYRGTATCVERPNAETLARYTQQVRQDARVPEALAAVEKAQADAKPVVVPKNPGEPSVIDHVIYVIKENRTFDQVMGDMKGGNCEPSLCIFGREATPNQHAIAEEFVLLDNYYCNGVLSADGHQWATQGDASDYLEKSFGGWSRSYPYPGNDPLAFVSSGFLWDNVLLHGRSFRNFGEMAVSSTIPSKATWSQIYKDWHEKSNKIRFQHKTAIAELKRYSCPDSPGWSLLIPDQIRADAFLKEFAQFERDGKMPNLTIIYLPNNHTNAVKPLAPTPPAMVADNDLAVGRIVEAISKSRFWPKSCIFITEDDPQGGFDHVDGHRSVCLVASPYTKRGKIISVFYNQTSVLRTMELMLGLPPMNQLDAMAPVMRECFDSTPDLRPFKALPNRVPLDQMNSAAHPFKGQVRIDAETSQRLAFDLPDQVDEDTLNRILWRSVKGVDVPYPSEFAGAHGKGLAKLHLKLDSAGPRSVDDDD